MNISKKIEFIKFLNGDGSGNNISECEEFTSTSTEQDDDGNCYLELSNGQIVNNEDFIIKEDGKFYKLSKEEFQEYII